MLDIVRLDYKFDISNLSNEVLNIINTVKLHKHHNQISLVHTPIKYENKEDWYEGCGSLKYKFGEDFFDKDNKLKPVDRVFKQSDFTVLNEYLKNTYIENVYNNIKSDFTFGRFRIMALPHKKCMSIHTDETRRIHIPIITDEKCKMMIEDKVYHLPADGSAYLTNTVKEHTAFDGTHSLLRIHLLFDLIE